MTAYVSLDPRQDICTVIRVTFFNEDQRRKDMGSSVATYSIDSGVPLPRGAGKQGRPMKYPWDRMNVGDSTIVYSRAATQAAWMWGRAHGKRFCSAAAGRGTYRVWRMR